jgi:Aminoglycoside-2''-adenylyltransferase
MKVKIPDATTCVPYHPREILSLLGSAPFPWWIAGGWTCDLFLGKQTRDHFDVDIAISRDDQLLAQHYLDKWDFWSTRRDENGNIILRAWELGQTLSHEFPGVWARESSDSPWRFEFLFQEIREQTWIFRYADDIQHSVTTIGRLSSECIPYQLPEISLLQKAWRLRKVDEQDFQQVLPHLSQGQRAQLSVDIYKLNPEHLWLSALV